jgi:hypothetical protein
MKTGSMIELQNRWYNCLTGQLGLDPAMFQISQPAAPMAARDSAVWDHCDAIPPFSLTFHRLYHQVPRFSSQYAAVVNQTGGEADTLEGIMGREARREWSEFRSRQVPAPRSNQLPALFLNWAMMRYPAVATAGASALARAVLETAAQPGMPRQFRGTYRELCETLRTSGGASLSFQAGAAPESVGGAWTGGAHSGVDGLWAGGEPDSRLSRIFADSGVAVEASFQGYAIWPSHPGPWYSEAALRAAFANPASPPWPEAPQPGWNTFFAPDGSMSRALASLVLVDGIEATIACNAIFTPQERAEVEINAAKGLWPFHAPASGIVTNEVTFGGSGGMRIRTVTKPGSPTVIGNNVLSMARYLGLTDR